MRRHQIVLLVGLNALASCSGGGGGGGGSSSQTITIRGVVTSAGAPVADAEVSVPGSQTPVRTDANGAFTLSARLGPGATRVKIAAGKEGYFNVRAETDGRSPLAFALDPIPATDDPSYRFIDPDFASGINPAPNFSCNFCHSDQFADWQASPHAVAATNVWMRDLYRNDFLAGAFENGVDTCAGCHAPSLAARSTAPDHSDARVDLAMGADSKGVHCDFCHKIEAVTATPAAGMYGDITLRRPSGPFGGTDLGLVFGSLTDSTYPFMRASPKPLYKDSLVCAPCHEDSNTLGLVSNDTYNEWVASPARTRGQGCQTCHMAPKGGRTSLLDPIPIIAELGDARSPDSIPSHDFTPVSATFLASALRVAPSASNHDGVVDVSAQVANVSGGHAIPTGIPERQLILLVLAKNQTGALLTRISGEELDDGAGAENPADPLDQRLAAGNFSGLPGSLFARRTIGFTVDGSGVEMDVPYWRAFDASDTRLGASEQRSLSWQFQAPAPGGTVRIEFRLLHRRLPKPLYDARNLGRFGTDQHAPLDLTFFSTTIDGNGAPVDTTPPVVTANPPGAVYTAAINVVLQSNEPATIYYTLDGTTPTTESLIHDAPLPISRFTVLSYFAVDVSGNASGIRSETYAVTPGPPVDYNRDIQPIFTEKCAITACHTSLSPAGAQNLSAGVSWMSIVNVDSIEVPALKRVLPLRSDRSYLVNKLLGTAGDVGGAPSRMPLGTPPLPSDQIELIRRWIDQGAPEFLPDD